MLLGGDVDNADKFAAGDDDADGNDADADDEDELGAETGCLAFAESSGTWPFPVSFPVDEAAPVSW